MKLSPRDEFSLFTCGEGKTEDVEDLSLPYAGANRFRFEGFVLSLQGTPSELSISKISSRYAASQKENHMRRTILSTFPVAGRKFCCHDGGMMIRMFMKLPGPGRNTGSLFIRLPFYSGRLSTPWR